MFHQQNHIFVSILGTCSGKRGSITMHICFERQEDSATHHAINEKHISNGVRMIDSSSVYIGEEVEIEEGVLLYPGVILEGKCKIGSKAIIGAGSNLKNTVIGVGVCVRQNVVIDADEITEIEEGATIYPNVIMEGSCKIGAGATIGANSNLTNTTVGSGAYVRQSVLIDAIVGANTDVGPFAYLRPKANIGDKCKVGSFVEVKNSNIGDSSSVAHLAYIGDSDVGSKVNVGCGVITANYDGKNKYRTTIGDNAFIGSNSNLIAPVSIGDDAFVAAGSTITHDVPDGAMGIARERQIVKLGWKSPKKS